MKERVDLIIHNGRIYTVNAAFDIVDALVIKDGKILECGEENYILDKYEGKTLDLKSAAAYPGFMDPHCHLIVYGRTFFQADLSESRSYEEMIALVREYSTDKTGEWILGRGWDQNKWPDGFFPTKKKLDELFPDKPVYLKRIDGHAALANQKALEIAGIDDNTKIDGGEFLKENGSLTGVLIDKAMDLVDEKIQFSYEENRNAILKAQEKLLSLGLCSIGDAWVEYGDLNQFQEMYEKEELKLRIYCMMLANNENRLFFEKNGPLKTERLNARAFKYFADGALGSRGAALLKEYSDDEGNKGLILHSKEYFREEAQWCFNHGFQMNCHAIGDSSNRMILDLYTSILNGENDLRWRIEHAQIVHPYDLYKFSENSIIPSIQTTHATSDMNWVEKRIGERVRYAYPAKSLLKNGGIVVNGSDFPIEKPDPILGFYSAISRKDFQGYPLQGFRPEEKLSRIEALKAMTFWAAYAQFEEDEKGSLEYGKFADIVVTSKDIMECGENEIPGTQVIYTILGGEVVYSKN